MQNTVNPGVGTRVISAGFPPQDPTARFSNYLKAYDETLHAN